MYQTVEGFLRAPFGSPEPKSNEFEKKYQKLIAGKKIHIEASTQIEDNYLLHFKVGSESNPNQFYDVIFLFFTDDPAVKRDISFRNYYVKFFSNSPSFIYQYAVLYKENDALIDMLYDKLDPNFADQAPSKSNPDMKLSYDKSIYSACRFMQDNKISAFSKVGILVKKKKKPDKFFADIKTFSDVKLDTEINQLDKKVDKELEKASKKDKEVVKKKSRSFGKQTASHSTLTAPKSSATKKISKTASIHQKRKPGKSTATRRQGKES